MNKENGRVNPTEIVGVVFMIPIAITFIAGSMCFYFSSKGKGYFDVADWWFKIAMTTGAVCIGIALMLILGVFE